MIQGILTGIGFLGAGVIVRGEHGFRVHGLTSAACTWLTACVGIACGVGQWRIVIAGLAIATLLLLLGRPLERWLHRTLGGKDEPAENSSLLRRKMRRRPDGCPAWPRRSGPVHGVAASVPCCNIFCETHRGRAK